MKSYEYFIQTERKHIDFINKIIEAYEGIGIVRTLDPKAGTIKIITIDCYVDDVNAIIEDFNIRGIKAEIKKQAEWGGVL